MSLYEGNYFLDAPTIVASGSVVALYSSEAGGQQFQLRHHELPDQVCGPLYPARVQRCVGSYLGH
jgi:hypothetical protein